MLDEIHRGGKPRQPESMTDMTNTTPPRPRPQPRPLKPEVRATEETSEKQKAMTAGRDSHSVFLFWFAFCFRSKQVNLPKRKQANAGMQQSDQESIPSCLG